jgi:AraC family transcriptional activator of mtrCDE
MGALSQLLELYPVRTALDVRCHFGAPWVLDHKGAGRGIAPYHLIVSGECTLEVGTRKEIALGPGDIILFPQGTPHRLHTGGAEGIHHAPRESRGSGPLPFLYNDSPGPETGILCGQFEFGADTANVLLSSLPELVHVRTAGGEGLAVLQQLIAMLRVETETVRPGGRAVISQLASALFVLLMRAWIEQGSALGGLFALLADARLRGALQAMLETPAHPWKVAELAAACNMSRAAFARLFQKVANTTPAQLLTETRMAKAAALLQSGRLPAGEVAEQVGYQSEAAFSRVFKRHFGIGPGAYRRTKPFANAGPGAG